MFNDRLLIPSIPLPKQVSEVLPAPKFQLGEVVRWSCVPTQDYGQIVGLIYGNEGSVKAQGYHYAIALDPSSPSYTDGIRSDWGFEDDLELVSFDEPTSDRSEAAG